MTTFNTGNPIGSTDARDLSDNAENFDVALGTISPTWVDRLGNIRDSFEGRLAKGSFYRVGDFAAGYTLTNMRQTLEYNGHEYSWAGTFPKVVAAASTPATTGGVGAGAWVDRTDVTLRSELAGADGRKLIGACADIATLRTTEPEADGQRIDVIGYCSGPPLVGGGTFYYDAADTSTADDGGMVFVTTGGARWKRWLGGSVAVATPLDFGCIGDGVTYDQAGLVAYDAYCALAGIQFDGLGLTYATTAPVFSCGAYRNANFVPFASHTGNGPTFKVGENGVCVHENITVHGYTNNGARVSRGDYSDVAGFVSRGVNDYSNNGTLLRTTTTSVVDMATAYVIAVADITGFAAGDFVWIGDGRYTILSTSTGTITLVNNGSQATLNAGSRNKFSAGQYVTKDADGQNGITIGDGGAGWDLDIAPGSVTANNCGWFGLFHWANTRAGIQQIDSVHASNCGFIGVGLGYTNIGYARGCVTNYNGNNGIDTLSSTSGFLITGGVSRYNGVEGVYAGSNGAGEIAVLSDYDCRSNRRMGWLLNASTIAAAYSVTNVDARDNDFRSFTLTGCGEGNVLNCKLGGAQFGNTIFIEGKNNCAGLQNHTIKDCIVEDNLGTDANIGGNFSDYTNSSLGILNLIDTLKADGSQLSAATSGVSPLKSKFRPGQRMTISVNASSVAAGGIITLTVNFSRPFNSSVADVGSNIARFSVFTDTSMTAQATINTVTRTSGVELVNNTAHWFASGNSGVITYNLSLTSAGTRYIVVESDGMRLGVLLAWT